MVGAGNSSPAIDAVLACRGAGICGRVGSGLSCGGYGECGWLCGGPRGGKSCRGCVSVGWPWCGALGSRIAELVVRGNVGVGGVVGRRGGKQALVQGGVPWVDVGGAGTGYAMG